MNKPAPVYCQECERANNAAAKLCIWCGVPLIEGDAPLNFELTRVEIDYLGGISRLDEPMTVKLAIDGTGVEVSEILPGSRRFKIPAELLIEAKVIDSSSIVEGKRVRPTWWWFAFGPFALASKGRKLPDTVKHDYILAIKYRHEGENASAVFHREDRLGASLVNGLARIITSLVRRTAERSKT